MGRRWRAAAMSSERGKPHGVFPAEVGFPDGTLGGINSPNWYTSPSERNRQLRLRQTKV